MLLALTAPKTGAFRDWKEDHEVAEIFLPLPADTLKKDIACVIHADKLLVRHVGLGKTLLHAEPLAGLLVPDESTWYLQGNDLLLIVLAKQWRGEHKSDQYWGGSLAAKDGVYECYMSPREVECARKAREQKEADAEAQRRERVRASQQALREQELKEAQAEAAAEKARLRKKAALQRQIDLDDDPVKRRSTSGGRRAKQQAGAGMSWQAWILLAVCFMLVPLVVHFGAEWRRSKNFQGEAAEERWYDRPVDD